jgi:rsbT co-antagonist protein RsbR
MKTIRAARLLGARGILVGISPEIADTLVTLDVGLEGIDTYFSLRQGLEAAFARLGARVVPHAVVA